jgi:hypothetical protein
MLNVECCFNRFKVLYYLRPPAHGTKHIRKMDKTFTGGASSSLHHKVILIFKAQYTNRASSLRVVMFSDCNSLTKVSSVG